MNQIKKLNKSKKQDEFDKLIELNEFDRLLYASIHKINQID